MNLESFTIHRYRQKRLNSYFQRMGKDNDNELFDDNVADMLKAQGYSIENAPRSVYSVDKLFDALSNYAPINARKVDLDQSFGYGMKLARSCFSRPVNERTLSMLPMTVETVYKITSNPSGSAGLTAYGCTKAEAMTRALERGLQILSGEKVPEPCLAFARTQFNGKTRLVWGYPYTMTLIEGLFASPLIRKFKSYNSPMAFAMTTVALGTKLRVAGYHRRYVYSVDFSRFDSTVPAKLIHEAFKILATWFNLDEIEPTSGIEYRQIFSVIERYFIHTPIVMPDGNIYKGKKHGVPSGSYFTQMIDSVVNTMICGALSQRFNLKVGFDDFFILGDDLLFFSDRKMSFEPIKAYVQEKFGMAVNIDKSAITEFGQEFHYLGRKWLNGIPYLDEEEIIKRMVFPERYRKYSKDKEKRLKEVKLLILSYASVYKNAWPIAKRLLGTRMWNKQGGVPIDCQVYHHYGGSHSEFTSGLERFLERYIRDKSGRSVPHTATQFWL